jgi:hypothetical protein
MGLEKTEARNDFAGEEEQEFNWPTDWVSLQSSAAGSKNRSRWTWKPRTLHRRKLWASNAVKTVTENNNLSMTVTCKI